MSGGRSTYVDWSLSSRSVDIGHMTPKSGGPAAQPGRAAALPPGNEITKPAQSQPSTYFRPRTGVSDQERQALPGIITDLVILGLVSVTAFALAVHFDLLERAVTWARQYEAWQLDELAVLIGVLALGLAWFSVRRWDDLRQEMKRRADSEAARELAEEALHLNLSRLKILHQVDRSLLAAHSSGEIAAIALDALRDLLGASVRANVVLIDGDPEYATVLASSVPDNPYLPVGMRLSLAEITAIGDLRDGRIIGIGDLAKLPVQVPLVQHLRAQGIGSLMMVPMHVHGELLGSLNLGATRPHAFLPEYEPLASEVAEALALAIYQTRLSAEVQLGRERLAKLSGRLIETQELERQRISRELHDQIGQALVALKLQLQSMSGLRDRDRLVVRLRESIAVIERTLRQVRDLSLDLRPSLLDDLGLVATLRWYLDRQAAWAGVSSRFVTDPDEMDLPPEVEVVAFRVAQEALTNALHHAQATEICVCLEKREGELLLRVQDDGTGFDAQALLRSANVSGSLGLLGMQERAQLAGGRLQIESAPGQGTMVMARFPLSIDSLRDPLVTTPEGRSL